MDLLLVNKVSLTGKFAKKTISNLDFGSESGKLKLRINGNAKDS